MHVETRISLMLIPLVALVLLNFQNFLLRSRSSKRYKSIQITCSLLSFKIITYVYEYFYSYASHKLLPFNIGANET